MAANTDCGLRNGNDYQAPKMEMWRLERGFETSNGAPPPTNQRLSLDALVFSKKQFKLGFWLHQRAEANSKADKANSFLLLRVNM